MKLCNGLLAVFCVLAFSACGEDKILGYYSCGGTGFQFKSNMVLMDGTGDAWRQYYVKDGAVFVQLNPSENIQMFSVNKTGGLVYRGNVCVKK